MNFVLILKTHIRNIFSQALYEYFAEKVLAQLNLALESRSDTSYSDAALRALFRLNNHNYVINALRRSSLMELLLLAEPNAERTYEDLLFKNQTNYVMYTFSKVKLYIEQTSEDAGKIIIQSFGII